MERIQQKLIESADKPVDSQFSVHVSRNTLKSISFIRPFGDVFCAVLDSSIYDPWSSSLPKLTFLPSCEEDLTTYPVTSLPETRHILGVETCTENRTVVLGHFNYPAKGKLIKVDIYSIDEDFRASLVRVFSTETLCAGSGLLGTFTSPRPGEFVALWGDLSNDTFFDTFKVTLKDEVETRIDTTRTEVAPCALKFGDLGELYPGAGGTLYSCRVYAVGGHHPDCIAVLLHKVRMSSDAQPSGSFHRVMRLPYPLLHVPAVSRGDKSRLSAQIERIVHNQTDGTDRALLRVMVEERIENIPVDSPVIAPSSATGSVSAVGVASAVTTAATSAPRMRRKITLKYVHLLLHLQSNSVLDMHTSHGYGDDACTTDSAGGRIVRFVPVLVEEEKGESRVTVAHVKQ